MSLTAYISQRNRINTMFGQMLLDHNNLTAEDKAALARQLESDLSPESLTCDGELRGAPLRAKAALLNKAKSQLEALGQKVSAY